MVKNKSIGGKIIFDALQEENCIVMAVNLRTPLGVVNGIIRAAKDTDSPIIFELARSESNLEGGYTAQTPATYAKVIMEAADAIDYDIYAIHADHIGIKKGDDQEIEDTKALVLEQIKQGYTSFAIDASHIFNFDGKTTQEELQGNIDATVKIAKFIAENYDGDDFGLEVEVGEIGKEDSNGRVLTTPEEATTFIGALHKAGVKPQLIAIANGSAHGNTYTDGKLVEQISIDIPQTKAIAKALRENNLGVAIAQHGITGTPRELISDKFPKGDILKGNVGTFWQNLVFEAYRIYEPELYNDIWHWTLDNHKDPNKSEEEIFGKNVKNSAKEFYDRINNIRPETADAIESMAYAQAKLFFKAFGSYKKAQIVRNSLR